MPSILAAQQPPFGSQQKIRQYIMKRTISIKELNDLESKKFLKAKSFPSLSPYHVLNVEKKKVLEENCFR
jgi:hypothetical protein